MESNITLRYPVGKFSPPTPVPQVVIDQCINTISSFPKRIKDATIDLSESQLDTPYREGGWTLKEVVHHCADSHMNAFIRFKLALSEDNPTIKPYSQDDWVKQPDVENVTIKVSIKLLEALHVRWSSLLKGMSDADFQRTFQHPEMEKSVSLAINLCLYAWHCDHHLGHITSLKDRMGW